MKKQIIIIGALIFLAACGQRNTGISQESISPTESTSSTSKAEIHLKYSNLADEDTRNRVKNALENAGESKDNIQNFFDSVDEYNNAVGSENLVTAMTLINSGFPEYNEDKLIDLWIDKGGFVGRNCRITSYSLMKDFINVGNPVTGDTTMLFSDFEAISDKNIFNSEEKKSFDSIFSYIDVSNTKDTDILAKEIKQDLKNKQITFHNDKMHMISVYMTLDDGSNKVQEFIGHTGILLNEGDQYLFIEKLAFQMPYQAVEFNNLKEVKDYLMGHYDNNGDLVAKPIIFMDSDVMAE